MLQGRESDQYQLDLWSYDVDDGSLQMRVDSKRLVGVEKLSDAERGVFLISARFVAVAVENR